MPSVPIVFDATEGQTGKIARRMGEAVRQAGSETAAVARHLVLNRFPGLCVALLIPLWGCVAGHTHHTVEDDSVRPYRANPRYWQYGGQPVLLLGASDDHNLFQWTGRRLDDQLDRLTAAGGNYVRNTMSSREEGNALPFAGSGGGYDLERWNPEYWNRLGRFLEETKDRNIIVQIEMWDMWDMHEEQWERNPWNPANNVNYTSENTRLSAAYARPRYRDGMSYGPPHDFFLSVPALQNDRLLLDFQERFVDQVLSVSLRYDHVLYCISNEIHPQYPPEWGWYWAGFIRDRAEQAGKRVWTAEMYWVFSFEHEQHRASLERPEVYDFFEASQNSAILDGEENWKNLQWVYERLGSRPRPINNTKIYGADTGPAWAGGVRNAIEKFWRNVIGGAASSRFHRPPAGTGLSAAAEASIRAARKLESLVPMWEVDPANLLLRHRAPNEAYVAARPGQAYALYFPDGGEVELDLRRHGGRFGGRFSLRWIDIRTGNWGPDAARIAGGDWVRLTAPGEGPWAAAITGTDPEFTRN